MDFQPPISPGGWSNVEGIPCSDSNCEWVKEGLCTLQVCMKELERNGNLTHEQVERLKVERIRYLRGSLDEWNPSYERKEGVNEV